MTLFDRTGAVAASTGMSNARFHKPPGPGNKPAVPPSPAPAPDWVPEPSAIPDTPDEDLGHHMDPLEEPSPGPS